MRVATKFGLSIAALSAIGASAVAIPSAMLMPACSNGETSGGSSGGGSGGSSSGSSSGGSDGSAGASYCGAVGATCCGQQGAPALTAGDVPNPECDDGTESSCNTTTSCSIAASCGNTGTASAKSCMPLANNTGGTWDFRMRRIILVAPSKLANATVQNGVVTSGVDMLEPQCGEEGTGLFNWLLSFNTTAMTVTTGGAPQCDTTGTPACDPFTTGYCFVKKNVNGIQVGPVTGAITQSTDGNGNSTYSTTPGAIPTLNIPIYFGSPPSIILLPISNGALEGVKISSDHNCIGSINVDALAGTACTDNYTTCSKWLTDGSLTGYITLKTANTVQVSLLSETLCSLLTGDTTGPLVNGFKTCAVDGSGNPTAKGNYCSTTQSAGGCNDSFWLAATFAASAVTINDGTGVPDCSGGGSTDSGAPPADSGGD